MEKAKGAGGLFAALLILCSLCVPLQALGAPVIDSIGPFPEEPGKSRPDPGEFVAINGSGFGDFQGRSKVLIGLTKQDRVKASVSSWSDIGIIFRVPYGCSFFGFEENADTREVARVNVWVKIRGGTDPGTAKTKFKVVKPDDFNCECPCDVNDDGLCNTTDIDVFNYRLAQAEATSTYDPTIDLNNDASNDRFDFHVLINTIELYECAMGSEW